jgi:hypothetical protein
METTFTMKTLDRIKRLMKTSKTFTKGMIQKNLSPQPSWNTVESVFSYLEKEKFIKVLKDKKSYKYVR